MADSMDSREKRQQFFKKIEGITKGYDLKKSTPNWFDGDEKVGQPLFQERSAAEKKEQLLDKKLYTVYRVVDGVYKAVAWNVPRIEKDILLDVVFRPKLVKINNNEGSFESEMSKYEAFPSDQKPTPKTDEPVWAE